MLVLALRRKLPLPCRNEGRHGKEKAPGPIAQTRGATNAQPVTFVTTPEPTVLPPSRRNAA